MLHVIAQHLAQRLVHQVRGGMIANRPRATFGVDLGVHQIADRNHTLDNPAVMAEHRRLDLDRVLDDQARGAVAQLSGVTDLPTTLGVERRVVEHHDGVVARTCARHCDAVDIDRGNRRAVALQLVVAMEGGGGAGVIQAGSHLEFASGACLLALAIHGRVEGGVVHRHAAFTAHIGSQVERETIGVVQLECDIAVEHVNFGCARNTE